MRSLLLIVRLVCVSVAMACASRGAAAASQAAQDSTARFRTALDAASFERRLAESRLVRLHFVDRVVETSHVRARANGLTFGESASGSSLVETPPQLATWPEIRRIEVGSTQAGPLALLGALAGIAYSVHWNREHPPEGLAVFFPGVVLGQVVLSTTLCAAGGAAVGGAIGTSIRQWDLVYEASGPMPAARPADPEAAVRTRDPVRARLRTDSGSYELARADITAEGVRDAGGRSSQGGEPTPQRLVAWSEIDSLQVHRSQVGRGAALGMVAGLALGGLGYGATPREHRSGAGVLILGGTGAVIGAGVADRRQRWETVYARDAR